MIRDWFRTTNALRAEFGRLRAQLAEAGDLLQEAREEAAELAAERDALRDRPAEAVRGRDLAWRLGADVSPTAATQREVLRERARADALEERLHRLQEANMAADCAP